MSPESVFVFYFFNQVFFEGEYSTVLVHKHLSKALLD